MAHEFRVALRARCVVLLPRGVVIRLENRHPALRTRETSFGSHARKGSAAASTRNSATQSAEPSLAVTPSSNAAASSPPGNRGCGLPISPIGRAGWMYRMLVRRALSGDGPGLRAPVGSPGVAPTQNESPGAAPAASVALTPVNGTWIFLSNAWRRGGVIALKPRAYVIEGCVELGDVGRGSWVWGLGVCV